MTESRRFMASIDTRMKILETSIVPFLGNYITASAAISVSMSLKEVS